LEVFGALAALVVAVAVAVGSGLGAATPTSGVAAAQAVRLQTVRHSIQIDGSVVRVISKPSGAVCYSAPHASGCASILGDSQLSYATGKAGKRIVLVGVAGADVKAVIARLSRDGTIWPKLRSGAFYAVLPKGYRLRAIVKVLAGGRRVTFRVAS
jgi:hypothetical protein